MNYIIKFILFTFLFQNGYGQVDAPVHLSYNLCNNFNETKKILDSEDNSIHFYLEKAHFKSIVLDSNFTKSQLKNYKIINISDFKDLAKQEREKEILNGEKEKTIRILFNDEVFRKIYLYEKIEGNLIKRYIVKWIEEIE